MGINRIIESTKTGVAGNLLLNTVAASIPTFSLQLIVLPYIGRIMPEEQYGLLLTILAVLNVVPVTFGNSLNSMRLLYRKEYDTRQMVGDFNPIFAIEGICTVVTVIAFSVFYFRQANEREIAIHIFLIGIIAFLWFASEYHIVAFQLVLRYDHILLNNLVLTIGFFVGLGLYRITGYWEFIYLIGYLMSLLFVFLKSDLWREPFKITVLFRTILKENSIYFLACLLYRLTTYADKMLLYPILGGYQVSVYYVATLAGKVVSVLINPATGVMLAYLSKQNTSEGKKSFSLVAKVGTIICVLGYFLCIVVSRPVLTLLYPQYVDGSMRYIWITTLTVVLSVLIALINPFIMRFLEMKWQMTINVIVIIVYVGGSLLLLNLFGLMGFCIGCCLANVIKIIVMLLIYKFAKKRES